MAWRFSACEKRQNLETLVSFQGEIYVSIGFFFYFNLHHLNTIICSKNSENKVPHLLFIQGFLSHQIFDFHTARISPMINTSYEGNLWNQILSPTVSNLMPVWRPPTLQPGDRTLQLRDHDQHHHPVPCHWRVVEP